MNNYTNDIKNSKIIGNKVIIRNNDINEKWSNYIIDSINGDGNCKKTNN